MYESPQDLKTKHRFDIVLRLVKERGMTIQDACKEIGISRRYFRFILTDEQAHELMLAKKQNSKALKHKPWFH